jgi:hypothetical protein
MGACDTTVGDEAEVAPGELAEDEDGDSAGDANSPPGVRGGEEGCDDENVCSSSLLIGSGESVTLISGLHGLSGLAGLLRELSGLCLGLLGLAMGLPGLLMGLRPRPRRVSVWVFSLTSMLIMLAHAVGRLLHDSARPTAWLLHSLERERLWRHH